jgi:3',5'-cyclic AMP phosphodiesterase CpdA
MTRVLHLSDPHFGAADPVVAAAFLARAKALAPDFTILSGDLTMRARTSELQAAKQFVDALPTPLLLIPGNHDVPNQPIERFFHPFLRYKKWFGPDLTPETIFGDLHIVSTNSTRAFGLHADWSEGILSQNQLAEISRRFNNGPAGLIRILVLHHPLLAPERHGRAVVKPLPELLRVINEERIDLVLCGHFHRSQLATAGTLQGWKCVVSQAATVCSTRLQAEPQGFHEIHVSADRIEIIPHTFDRDRFIPGPPLGFVRDAAAGWRDCDSTQTDEIVSTQ